MVTKLRLLAALGALVTAVVVVSQSAPPANVGIPKVQLRSTAAPMDPPTTMKSPIVATTDPSPFDPCQDISHPAVAVLLDDLLQPGSRLPIHQPAAGKRSFPLLQVLSPHPWVRP